MAKPLDFDRIKVYAYDAKVLGWIAEYDGISKKLIISDERGNTYKANPKNVIILKRVAEVNGKDIYEGDVVRIKSDNDGCLYELHLTEDDVLEIYALDHKYQRTNRVSITEDISSCISEAVGNAYVIRDQLSVDFNIKFVKRIDVDGYDTFWYALNNKQNEEIDLIEAMFYKDKILKDKEYKKQTLSYEEYQKRVLDKSLMEINEKIFANYITGKGYENFINSYSDTMYDSYDWGLDY